MALLAIIFDYEIKLLIKLEFDFQFLLFSYWLENWNIERRETRDVIMQMPGKCENKKENSDLNEISRSWDWHVRRKLAWNPDTPEEILQFLAKDAVQWVREAVAGNANVSVQSLTRLADDSSGFVRAAVALNSKATAELLEMMVTDEMVDYDSDMQKNRYLVKEAVAKNPNIDLEPLAFLARDSDEHVRAAAASNPLLTSDLMAKLAKDVSWLVRNNIAKNPSTHEELLIYLSEDRILDVRATVALNPKTPSSALIGSCHR